MRRWLPPLLFHREATLSVHPPRAAGRKTEKGYVLIVFLLFSALLVVGLSRIMPKAVFEGKRQKEEELIFRGLQYQRAIQVFFRKFGRYPNSLDELEETNGVRFLRKRYRDPITGEDEWRLIHIGPGGVFPDALHQPAPPANLGALPTPATSLSQQGSTGLVPSSGLFGSREPSQAGRQQSSAPAALLESVQASGQAIGQAIAGQTQPRNPALSPSANPGANPLLRPRAFAQSQQQSGGAGQPASRQATSGSSPQSIGAQIFGGGGVAGVASRSTEESIKVRNGYSQYNEWEFIYNFRWDPLSVATLARIAGAQRQTPTPPAAPAQAQPPAAPTATPPRRQPQWLGTPPSDRPTPPAFPPSPIPRISPPRRQR